MLRCSNAQMLKCSNTQMLICLNVQMQQTQQHSSSKQNNTYIYLYIYIHIAIYVRVGKVGQAVCNGHGLPRATTVDLNLASHGQCLLEQACCFGHLPPLLERFSERLQLVCHLCVDLSIVSCGHSLHIYCTCIDSCKSNCFVF